MESPQTTSDKLPTQDSPNIAEINSKRWCKSNPDSEIKIDREASASSYSLMFSWGEQRFYVTNFFGLNKNPRVGIHPFEGLSAERVGEVKKLAVKGEIIEYIISNGIDLPQFNIPYDSSEIQIKLENLPPQIKLSSHTLSGHKQYEFDNSQFVVFEGQVYEYGLLTEFVPYGYLNSVNDRIKGFVLALEVTFKVEDGVDKS